MRLVHGVPVHGIDVDIHGRCAHWLGPTDIVVLRMKCCGLWVSCFDCHQAIADHPAQVWPVGCRNAKAVLCGACGSRLGIAEYLDNSAACPDARHTSTRGANITIICISKWLDR